MSYNKVMITGPRSCINTSPNPQTVYFGGAFVSLSAIAVTTGLSPSAISRIFSGDRNPSLIAARKISTALMMDVGDFVHKLADHVPSRVLKAS